MGSIVTKLILVLLSKAIATILVKVVFLKFKFLSHYVHNENSMYFYQYLQYENKYKCNVWLQLYGHKKFDLQMKYVCYL